MAKRVLAAVLSFSLLVPSVALAQQGAPAGVVTVTEGTVTRRVALPNATDTPLNFKDSVFYQDTVTTKERSLARMLLGGKAVVTVRERSVLTITEVPNKTTIDLASGKFALAVARERMNQGESIEIRTPNAVAGVRGTVVITEVEQVGAQATPSVPAITTNFHVLRGAIEVQRLDPTRQPFGAPFQVGTLQTYTGAGIAVPRVIPLPADQIARVTSGLQPTGQKRGGDTVKDQAKAQAVQTATALASALSGEAPSGSGSLNPAQATSYSPGANYAPIIPNFSNCVSSACAELTGLFGTPFASFDDLFISNLTTPLFLFTNQSLTRTSSFFRVGPNGDVRLAGPLAQFIDSFISTGGNLLEIQGGKLRSTSTSSLLDLDPTFISATQSLILMNGGSLTLAGPLLFDTDGFLVTSKSFLEMTNSATLTSTSTNPLVTLDGTTIGSSAGLTMTNSTMTLAGPLLDAHEVTSITPPNPVNSPLFSLNRSTLTSTSTSPLVQLRELGFASTQNFFQLSNGSTMTLAGGLLSATNAELRSGNPATNTFSFFTIFDGSRVQSTGTGPLLSFTNSSLDSASNFTTVRRSAAGTPSRLQLAGPLLVASNSTFNHTSLGFGATFGTASACCSGFAVEQGAQLTSSTTQALLQFTNSTVVGRDAQSGGNFFFVADSFTGAPAGELVASANVSLAGPLLNATTSTFNELFSLLQVRRSTFTSTTTSPLVSLSGGTMTLGGTNVIDGTTALGRALHVFSADTSGTVALPSSMTLAGPFLRMTNGATLTSNSDLIGVFNGANVTSTSTAAFVDINAAAATALTLARVTGTGSTNGTTPASLNLSGTLLSVSNGGSFNANDPTQAMTRVTAGTHTISPTTPMVNLTGRAGAVATEVQSGNTLSLGTDQPLVHTGSGAFFQADGATVTTFQGVAIDTALLQATAPLFNLTRNGATPSSLTTAADGLDMVKNAKLTAIGPLARIDGSTFTVNSGNLFSIRNGSFMNVSGDLVSLLNNGALHIVNGGVLYANNGSVVNITGGVINFGTATGNSVTIAGSPFNCGSPCSTVGGIPFLQLNAGLVTIGGTPVKNLGSNTLSFPANTPAVIADNAKINISGL